MFVSHLIIPWNRGFFLNKNKSQALIKKNKGDKMKKIISTIIILTVFLTNTFIIHSQAQAASLKYGIYALVKGTQVYNSQQRKK